MARTARASVGGVCYRVLNRGNAREEVFHKKEDYAAFLDLMEEAGERLPMRLLAWCLIPNHFHGTIKGISPITYAPEVFYKIEKSILHEFQSPERCETVHGMVRIVLSHQ